ncbi:MAG: AgmX/PglI C-terminal domain-containing protein [Deltaproteobacteria bacterium]|nr:AgmX/PglI C-terminal domain-containing protein [Deltaproteobacteria bacterium]
MRYRFLVKSPDGKEDIFEFEKESIIVGSSTAANIRLESENVSGLHCMIRVNKEGNLSLMDMGSKSGVFVNGEKVREKTLSNDDIIKIGEYEIRLVLEDKSSIDERVEQVAKSDRTKNVVIKDKEKKAKKIRRKSADSLEMYVSVKRLEEDKADEINKVPDVIVRWLGGIIGEVAIIGKKSEINIGTSEDNDFVIPEEYIKFDRFQLITTEGSSHVVNVPENWDVIQFVDGKRVETDTKKNIQLRLNEVIVLKNGPIDIIIRYVHPKSAPKQDLLKNMDYRFAQWLISSILFLAITLFIMVVFFKDTLTTPPEDLQKSLNRFAKVVVKEAPKKVEKKELEMKAITEKKIGKVIDEKRPPVKGPNIADPNRRVENRKIALKSGILGILRGAGGNPAMNSIFGAGLGAGINNALGGLHGTMMGDSGGLGGLGSRGGGGGGGVAALGGIGIGGGKSRRAHGDFNLGAGGKSEEAVSTGKLVMVGGLDKDVVAKVIKRYWAQIKYCYEKELSKNPNLYGKIAVKFTISSNGSVSEAEIEQTEMNNAAVEDCIIRNIKRWMFPAPKGGGIVVVRYPFIFKSAGQ